MDVQFDQEYNVGVVQAVPINVYDYYEPGEIKHFSWMKLLNFDGEIPIYMLLLLLLFFLPLQTSRVASFTCQI